MRMFSRSRIARGGYTCPAMLLSGSGRGPLGDGERSVASSSDAARLLLLSWSRAAQPELMLLSWRSYAELQRRDCSEPRQGVRQPMARRAERVAAIGCGRAPGGDAFCNTARSSNYDSFQQPLSLGANRGQHYVQGLRCLQRKLAKSMRQTLSSWMNLSRVPPATGHWFRNRQE